MPKNHECEPLSTPNGLSLVVTLGPSSLGMEAELAALGASQFRINASHMTPNGLSERIACAHQAAPTVPVIVDIQGAKMRLGDFSPREVGEGDSVHFELADNASSAAIQLPHPEVYTALLPGDRVNIDDGRLSAEVVQVQAGAFEVRILVGGTLKPRKGFNREDHPVVLRDLCARDIEMVQVAYEAGCRAFAVSFVADGRECDWVRQRASGVEVVAKIERQDALQSLGSIAQRADALWICRGDLGVQVGLINLGRTIAELMPRNLGKPVFMAGQVFEHLTTHRDSTRSEVCHLYDLVKRGYSGIVLSDETAIGCDPINATRLARTLLNASVQDLTGEAFNEGDRATIHDLPA